MTFDALCSSLRPGRVEVVAAAIRSWPPTGSSLMVWVTCSIHIPANLTMPDHIIHSQGVN